MVVTNARHIQVSGQKSEQIVYRRHTMYPGGLKETPYEVMLDKKPEEVRISFTCDGFPLTIYTDHT